MGDLLSLLYVSNDESSWDEDREWLVNEDGLMYSMVINLDDDTFSEVGTIQVRPAMGGVVRTA